VLIAIEALLVPQAGGAALALPVVLAALYTGWFPALALAIALPLAPWLVTVVRADAWSASSFGAAALRIAVLLVIARLAARRVPREADVEREVAVLRGLLPICMHCKSIRNERGEWEPLESYFTQRTETTFTHGLCRRCADVHYPDYPRVNQVEATS
jgi:hypothetical protein